MVPPHWMGQAIGIWKAVILCLLRRTTSSAVRAVETDVAIAPTSPNTRPEPKPFALIRTKRSALKEAQGNC